MKNMVVDEVYCTLTITSLAITLSTNKSFLSHHLFNEDGEGPMELFKVEKLNQTLLKFIHVCSLGICNLIASLKHHPNNLGSLHYILKLKALSGYNYIENNYLHGQQAGQKVYLFKMFIHVIASGFDLV
jgi:hypothetical protein